MEKIYEYQTKYSASYISERLPELISRFNKDYKRKFLYRDKGQNEIRIGIEKGDHAGRWFIGKLEGTSSGTKISGIIKYDSDGNTGKSKTNLFTEICAWAMFGVFCIIFCVPILIYWLITLIRKTKTNEEYLDIFFKEYLQCEKIETAEPCADSQAN